MRLMCSISSGRNMHLVKVLIMV
uniref:Uncharacterized protein n=1 Tax=Arundo donax TaxID=35708 RepID=A0A0A9HJW3_ARUDO